MSLNIKNERTHELVRELANRLGVSQVSAVEQAVLAKLAELDAPVEDDRAARAAAADETMRSIRDLLGPEGLAQLATAQDDLFDEYGLPR